MIFCAIAQSDIMPCGIVISLPLAKVILYSPFNSRSEYHLDFSPNITAKQYHSPKANITEKTLVLSNKSFFLEAPPGDRLGSIPEITTQKKKHTVRCVFLLAVRLILEPYSITQAIEQKQFYLKSYSLRYDRNSKFFLLLSL